MLKKFFKKFSRSKNESAKHSYPEKFNKKHDMTLIEKHGPVSSPESIKEISSNKIEIDIYVNGEKISTTRISDHFVRIGRDPSQVDIIVAEPIISKLHCTFERSGNDLFITDNHSTNGLYINSIKTVKHQLKNGDIVSLGKKGTVQLFIHMED